MIDISNIEIQHLETLSKIYSDIHLHFNIEPCDASARKQKKMRLWLDQWLEENYKENLFQLPKNILSYFSPQVSDRDLFAFLKNCNEQILQNGSIEMQQFKKALTKLPEDAKSAFLELYERYCTDIIPHENSIEIIIDDTCAYKRSIFLYNIDGLEMDKDCYYIYNISLIASETGYKLSGELEKSTDDTTIPLSITFTDIKVKVQVYNCTDCILYFENPWDILCNLANAIRTKDSLPGQYCNKQEQELLPLLTEIASLQNWVILSEQHGHEYSHFPELKALTAKYGYDKITDLLDVLEKTNMESKKYYNLIRKIRLTLCEQAYEPLWRDIFDKIRQSQAEYPNRVELNCPTDMLNDTRNTIQQLMEQHGYSGVYPDFIKEGPLRGIHLEQSYDMTYFVGLKKRAVYRIHCSESFGDYNNFTVQFLCGTELLRKSEALTDIYSCLFNAKGRKLFHLMEYHCYTFPIGIEQDEQSDDIEQCVKIAVKKAELRRLTKEERKLCYGVFLPGWIIFWSIFITGGGFFGIAMTLGFMLIELIVALTSGQINAFPELFIETPWWLILLFCWIGFGGIMGLLTVLAKRK